MTASADLFQAFEYLDKADDHYILILVHHRHQDLITFLSERRCQDRKSRFRSLGLTSDPNRWYLADESQIIYVKYDQHLLIKGAHHQELNLSVLPSDLARWLVEGKDA